MHEPSPFVDDAVYCNVPLIAELVEQGTTMPDAYRSMVDDNQDQIAAVGAEGSFSTVTHAGSRVSLAGTYHRHIGNRIRAGNATLP